MRKSSLFFLFVLSGVVVSAAAQPTVPVVPLQRELIYCADQMTPEEREAYRAKMRAAKTTEEQEKIRVDHQAAMQERVRAPGGTGQCQAVGRQIRAGARP